MKQVHFVDTSILCCLLRVPKFCDNEYMDVEEELLSIISRGETLILPIAGIIKTGNHIAHISDGNTRRAVAGKFADYLRDTADNKAPWSLISLEWTPDDLRKFAAGCPGSKVQPRAYRKYIRTVKGGLSSL